VHKVNLASSSESCAQSGFSQFFRKPITFSYLYFSDNLCSGV
jgi:hypothetical protein